jgi:hypothetical protein
VATVVAPLLSRGWRWTPFGLATVVAVTRVYYGACLPFDVWGVWGSAS